MNKFQILVSFIVVAFTCTAFGAGQSTRGGSGSHGGSRLQSDFFKGQRQAAHVVNVANASTVARATDDEAVRSWIMQNKAPLRNMLLALKLKFNDDKDQEHCGMVLDNDPEGSVVYLSRPKCENITSTPKAGELLIHESIHLLGIESETFAPKVADVLYTAWEFAGHTLDVNLHSIAAENAPSGRELHAAVWTGSQLLVWGGDTVEKNRSNDPSSSGAAYDHVLDQWKPISKINAPLGRHEHSAVWTGSEMIVWGGASGTPYGSGQYSTFNDGGRYDPITDTWKTITNKNAPTARFNHKAVWTDKEMVVWGGVYSDGAPFPVFSFLGNGAAYNPLTDTWRAISNRNAPSPRMEHTVIWTGDKTKKMIVWGGQFMNNSTNGIETLGDGAIYDPEADSWQTMPKENAPVARAGHTAVWTGEKMIVWGGYTVTGGSRLLNCGGVYDLKTNSWTPTKMINQPDARDQHVAVWSGSHMIIFGGRNPTPVEPESRWHSPDTYQTIGLYDPETQEWSTPIFKDTWMDRRGAVAAWTGHEMIVWGGEGQRRSGRVFYP